MSSGHMSRVISVPYGYAIFSCSTNPSAVVKIKEKKGIAIMEESCTQMSYMKTFMDKKGTKTRKKLSPASLDS